MKNSCIRSGFLRQILIWLTVQNISICIFWGKGESNKGRSSVTKLQLYLRIHGTCLCFFEVAGGFVFKIRTCKVKPGWIEKSISKFWTRCVISLCFDAELLQNLLEASTLPLIYFRMSHSREAFCRRGVSTFHRKGFFKGTVSGARKPVALRMQCDGSRMWGKENR